MNFAVCGFGHMGRSVTQILLDKGCTVAAIVDPSDDAAAHLRQLRQQYSGFNPVLVKKIPVLAPLGVGTVVHSFATSLRDIHDAALECATQRVNVLSIAEDAFDPFFDDHDKPLAEEIDQAFRRSERYLLSTGVQDSYLYRLPLALHMAHTGVRRMRISNTADLAILGPAVFNHMPIGKTLEQGRGFVEGGFSGRVCFDVGIRPLVRRLGRSIKEVTNALSLVAADVDIKSPVHQLRIHKGDVCGVEERTRLQLDDGSELDLSLKFSFSPPNTKVTFKYEIEAGTSSVGHVEPFDGVTATCATLVNRALETRAYPSGFISVDQLP